MYGPIKVQGWNRGSTVFENRGSTAFGNKVQTGQAVDEIKALYEAI
jgi:hypothetical protein